MQCRAAKWRWGARTGAQHAERGHGPLQEVPGDQGGRVRLRSPGRGQDSEQVCKHACLYVSKHVHLCSVAIIYKRQGKLPEALEFYHKSLATKEKVLGCEHPLAADTKNNIAVVYEKQAKYPQALQMLQEVLEIRLKTFGPDHPLVADTKNK